MLSKVLMNILAFLALLAAAQPSILNNPARNVSSSGSRIFGCSDLTPSGCSVCLNHKVAFENVCVWCTEDSECHDVGSLEDPCCAGSLKPCDTCDR